MRHRYRPAVIFSAELAENTAEDNASRTLAVMQALHRETIPFRVFKGRYNGTNEISFYVPAMHRDFVLGLAASQGQESILELGPDWDAILIFTDGRDAVRLGYFREVNEATAKASDAFTHDPVENRYFVVS